MSQIEQMLDVTSVFIKTVDKVDIELIAKDPASSFIYLIQAQKSVRTRQQIAPKVKKDDSRTIKFKQGGFDTLEGIYSWCGFSWLEVILEMPHKTNLKFEPVSMERKVIRFENTAPGWVDLPSIFLNFRGWPMRMTVIIKYQENTKAPPQQDILVRGLTLDTPVRLELSNTLEHKVPYPS